MKRFFSLLTVFVLAFALAVPVGASGVTKVYNGVQLPDVDTVWTDKSTYKYAAIENSNKGYLLTLYGDFTGAYRYPLVDDYYIYGEGSPYVNYVASGDSWTVNNSGSGASRLAESDYLWSSFDIYTDASKTEVLHAATNPAPLICNGDACSALDENFNGLCDECGMALMNLSRSPVPPAVDGTNKHYALFSGTWDGLQGWYYVVSTSSADYTIRGDLVGDYYKVTYDNQAESSMYVSYDGINWERKAMSFTSSRFVPKNSTTELVDSSHNWYDESGELFFPLPLWMEIQGVTEGEMLTMPLTVGGVMKILAVCGVGCLALLAVLKLFGKRLLIFRS